MTSAERFSVSAALAAVIVSAATAYFQFFWKNQDFRVQWFVSDTGYPSLASEPPSTKEGRGHIKIKMSPTVILINHGNQNVIVTDIGLELLYSKDANPANLWSHGTNPPLSDCNTKNAKGSLGPWEKITIDSKSEEPRPLVVEPGKSIPIRVYFRPIDELVDNSWRSDSEVSTCFYFQLIDLNGNSYRKSIPALTFSSSGGHGLKQSAAIVLLN